MVSRILRGNAVVRAKVQHAVEEVITVSAEALPPTEQGRPLWKLLTQAVVWAVRKLQLQKQHI